MLQSRGHTKLRASRLSMLISVVSNSLNLYNSQVHDVKITRAQGVPKRVGYAKLCYHSVLCLQDKLGDVVYAELPEVGLELAVEGKLVVELQLQRVVTLIRPVEPFAAGIKTFD